MDIAKARAIKDFVDFCKDALQISELPQIYFTENREWAVQRRSFGEYNAGIPSITVYANNRNTADVIRTLAHEMVHHRQNELGLISLGSGKTGTKIEDQANALAGILLREYGLMNDMIYESRLTQNKKNEVFSAYHGRYVFDVTKAYDYIRNGKVKSKIQTIDPDRLHFFSHPEFSYTSPEKVSKLKIDYEKPLGILVKFEDPESKKTEWILIDGNHRVRKAAEEKQSAKIYVISDPKDTEKFMRVDPSKPHKLFPDEED